MKTRLLLFLYCFSTSILFAQPHALTVLNGYGSGTYAAGETYATHRFNSDLFGSDLRFMLSLCEETNAVSEPFAEQIFLTPNPANDMINIPNEGKTYTMYDVNGSIVFKGNASQLNISYWNAGMYVIVCGNKTGKFLKAN